MLGGKVYNDPAGTRTTLGDVSLRGMKGTIYALHRSELARLYSLCLDRDMTMRLAAIPKDYQPMFPTYEYDRAKTLKLFCEGYTRGHDGRAWDDRSPERAVSEDYIRRGTTFATSKSAD